MRELLDTADFVCKARRRMRSGEYSREPLLLLRVEWKEPSVECDWLMRPADPWDRDLPARMGEENQTLQALRDALSLRDMIFESFPAVLNADLRMFRADSDNCLELMMTGSVNRSNEVMQRVPSVAMRARLCGFRFSLAEGVLESLNSVSLSVSKFA